jgi:hypothetical protein
MMIGTSAYFAWTARTRAMPFMFGIWPSVTSRSTSPPSWSITGSAVVPFLLSNTLKPSRRKDIGDDARTARFVDHDGDPGQEHHHISTPNKMIVIAPTRGGRLSQMGVCSSWLDGQVQSGAAPVSVARLAGVPVLKWGYRKLASPTPGRITPKSLSCLKKGASAGLGTRNALTACNGRSE